MEGRGLGGKPLAPRPAPPSAPEAGAVVEAVDKVLRRMEPRGVLGVVVPLLLGSLLPAPEGAETAERGARSMPALAEGTRRGSV